MIGITAFGAYVPRLRLQKKAMAQTNAWLAPNLMGKAKGERAFGNWDEDAITFAVEAARDALGPEDDRSHIKALYFAYHRALRRPLERRHCASGLDAGILDPIRRYFRHPESWHDGAGASLMRCQWRT